MNDPEVLTRLKPLITEVTGVQADDVLMKSVLSTDLGAESIDLLDLSFLIEEEFGIAIEADEFERQARDRMGGAEYERDGCLTDEALEELRKALPEVNPDRLAPGLRKADIPNLLTVAVFVHLIQRKRGQPAKGHVHA